MKRALPFLIILIVLGAGFFLVRYLQTPATPPATPTPPASNASPAAKVVNRGEPGAEPPHVHGNADAKVTLEEFGDFECPPCAALHPILKHDGKGVWSSQAAHSFS